MAAEETTPLFERTSFVDVLQHVLLFADWRARGSAPSVCKTWRDALLQADKLAATSPLFWRALSQAVGVRLPPTASPVALRSQADPRRTFIRGLRQRRERLVQAVDGHAAAKFCGHGGAVGPVLA